MIKRMLAQVLSMFIILALFAAVPIAADSTLPANIAKDYVASTEKQGNIITGDGTIGGTYTYNWAQSAMGATGASGDANYFASSSSVAIIDPTTKADGSAYYHNAVEGFNITTSADADATGRVVFSFNLKGTRNTPVITMGRRNETYGSTNVAERIEYSVEHGKAGTTPGSSYQIFKGTFADTGAASSKYKYQFGFVNGTALDSQIFFKPADSYIGYEYAYDMTVTADSKQLSVDGVINVDADIVNQIGNTYSGSQEVSWYALNRERTEKVSGFTITPGENGTATVTADDSVLSGTYALVAVSNLNSDFVKGIEITVAGRDFSDYAPGDVEGNEIVNNSALLGPNYIPFDLTSIGTADEGTDNEAWEFETIEDIPASGVIGANGLGAAGASIKKAGYDADSLLKEGKNIVIGAKVRATKGTPTIQAAMYQYGIEPTFPVEYPEGMKLGGSHWQDFIATFHIPEEGWKGAYNTNFYFGYAYTGLVDECEREFTVKKNSFYIGEEYAYDMKVNASSNICIPGKTTSFIVDAVVVNQLGSTGYLDQNVTWYALSDDRTAYADGITIVKNDSNSATVTVADTVTVGTYDIVAVSDTYDSIQKGVSIKVDNPYEDYVPDDAMLYNLIDDTVEGEILYNASHIDTDSHNIGFGTSDSGTDDEAWNVYIRSSVPETVLDTGGSGVSGVGIDIEEKFDGMTNLAIGKRIVIGAKVKQYSNVWYGISGEAAIKTSLHQGERDPIFPVEYSGGSDGFKVSSSDWQKFGATIEIPESWRGAYHTRLYLGFAANDQSKKGFSVKKDSFYIGYERAYDIKVSADSTEWNEGTTTTITVNADVVNQVGTEGYLNQNVTWHALNCTRTAEVAGITVKENTDGTATVTVAESVSSGVYDIVAVSDAYEGFAKGIRITVVTDEEPVERVTVFSLTETSGVATLTAAVADTQATEIFFAIASYDENNKMIKSKVCPVTVVDGLATVKGLSIDEVVVGLKVRGFVWENLTWRPIEFAESVENTILIKDEE